MKMGQDTTSRVIFTLLLILFVTVGVNAVENKCIHLHYPEFNVTLPKTSDCTICNREFRVTFLRLIPYSNRKATKLIENVLKSCCQRCPKFKLIKDNYKFLKSSNFQLNGYMIRRSLIEDDVIYPIFAYSKSIQVYGHYFIPFYDPFGAIYVTEHKKFSLIQLLHACAKLWSLLAASVVMAIIAGFIAWVLESRDNEEEFPRQFIRGWLEGIWWSFISMTTVGYGDKTPRSLAARIFSVAWILTGIVSFGVLAGSLTTIIMDESMPQPPSMAGGTIGMLRNRIYDANIIAAHGGSMYPAMWCLHESQSIYHLLQGLKDGKIDGFLLDKYTFWKWKNDMQRDNILISSRKALNDSLCRQIREKVRKRCNETVQNHGCHLPCHLFKNVECRKHLLEYFSDKIMETDIPHLGMEVAYGILVKNRTHYDFFRDAFMNNKMTFKSILSSQYANNTKKVREDIAMKLNEISHNRLVFIFFATTLGLIVCFGIVYEIVRNRRSEDNGVDSSDHSSDSKSLSKQKKEVFGLLKTTVTSGNEEQSKGPVKEKKAPCCACGF